MIGLIAICITIATLTSLIFVPVVRQVAIAVGMIDRPDQNRKLQSDAVSLGGGVAVFAALVVAFVCTIWIDRAWFGRSLGSVSYAWYILFGSAGAILLVGLIDDRFGLRGRQKLLAQCLIVACLVGSGTEISQLNLLGYQVELGVLAFPFSVVWLLLAINALNLIDGADGMATTVGTIICVGIGFLSLAVASPLAAVVGFALAGAQLGFLYFNKPPAKIYLGDAGSMMIGLFVGVLSTWGNLKESAVLAAAPIAILAIPLFDSSAAILRRWLTGRSIYTTDRAHLHHLLQHRYGHTGMLLMVAVLCIITTTLSVLSVTFHQPWLALAGAGAAALVLVCTRSFGNAEVKLVVGRFDSFVRSFFTHTDECASRKLEHEVAMQGKEGTWGTVWQPLVEFAETHQMARIKIDLNLPWLEEGFHASWRSVRMPEKASQLKVCLPLFTRRDTTGSGLPEDVVRVQIGLLEVVAIAEDEMAYQRVGDLTDKLADLGGAIDVVVKKLESRNVRVLQTPNVVGEQGDVVSEPSDVAESAIDYAS